MSSGAQVSVAETRYEVAWFESREATTPVSTGRVVWCDDGYHVAGLAGEKVGAAHPSLLAVLERHPELVVVTTVGTTIIHSSELKDWEIGDRLVVDDVNALDNIDSPRSTDVTADNGRALDLLCTINDADWWYFQLTDEPAGFFVPDDLLSRPDVEEVAHCWWVPATSPVDSWGSTLFRLGTLYECYAGEGYDYLYRTASPPRDEARQYFRSDVEVFRGLSAGSESVDLGSPYLSEADFEEVIRSLLSGEFDSDPQVLTVNDSPWTKIDRGAWQPGPHIDTETT